MHVREDFRACYLLGSRFSVIHTDFEMSQELVANHMAVLLSIGETHKIAYTKYVAEPILAQGSCLAINNAKFNDLLIALYGLVTTGKVGVLTDTGSYGEFVGSIILARAYDRTIHDDMHGMKKVMEKMGCKSTWKNEWNPKDTLAADYGRPIPLGVWLFSLLGDNARQIFEGCKYDLDAMDNDDNSVPSDNARLQLLNGFVRILQFVDLAKTDITEDELRSAWCMGVGLLTQPNHGGCDIIIPVQLPNKKMTGVFVEVKTHETPIGKRSHDGFMSRLNMAARQIVKAKDSGPGGDLARPVCLILMQVGQGGGVQNMEKSVRMKIEVPKESKECKEAKEADKWPNHYVLIDDTSREGTFTTQRAGGVAGRVTRSKAAKMRERKDRGKEQLISTGDLAISCFGLSNRTYDKCCMKEEELETLSFYSKIRKGPYNDMFDWTKKVKDIKADKIMNVYADLHRGSFRDGAE